MDGKVFINLSSVGVASDQGSIKWTKELHIHKMIVNINDLNSGGLNLYGAGDPK